MRVGLFGGTFDPPHNAHLAVASAACELGRLDRVIWMPASNPPHKPSATAAGSDRFEMTRIAVEGDPSIEVSRLELDREGPS